MILAVYESVGVAMTVLAVAWPQVPPLLSEGVARNVRMPGEEPAVTEVET